MATEVTNGYCTLLELKDWLGIDSNAADDAKLNDAINAASRWIDKKTGQYFYKSSEDETRYFTTDNPLKVRLTPFVSVTSVALDIDESGTWETSMESTEYAKWPPNAGTNEPYLELRIRRGNLVNAFPRTMEGVKVVGVFGWPSVPHDVKQACLMYAHRLFVRRNSPDGVAGANAFGIVRVSASDSDILALLADYMGPRV